MKFIFIDTETTGVDPIRHGMIQVAGSIYINAECVESFDIKARPFPNDDIEQEALDCNKRTREEIESWPSPEEAHDRLASILGAYVNKMDKKDKFYFYAYNARFDADFLREWFVKCGDHYYGSWFWTPPIDVMSTAALALREERPGMLNFKLGTVAATLGIEVDPERQHDAVYDISVTVEIMKRAMARIRGAG